MIHIIMLVLYLIIKEFTPMINFLKPIIGLQKYKQKCHTDTYNLFYKIFIDMFLYVNIRLSLTVHIL